MGVDAAAEEQFGPYLVYERLGVGGMATVHRALERGAEGFERVVALKRLLPHLAEDASFIKSFVREAKLASLLNHVNIVQIYELGRVGTEYFISMEYIDGRDLRRVLRHARKVTGPPPIHVTVGIMLQLAEALDYAHGKSDDHGHPLGLVHRDVSPSNLLITSEGHLKVIDFGIARAQSSQLRTQTGRVKGKLAYMAPEAVNNKDLDARSDLWAAGVILHELLTARPLFASKNEYQTLLKVQRADITPPSTFNQACPAELDAIVYRALARDPEDRFAHAGELRDELLAIRKQYQLQTGVRDLAQWLDWAFSLELPAGFAGNTLESTGSKSAVGSDRVPRPPSSRPARNRDEDEAVEMVWGTAEGEPSGPVVLDDVPDVSEKHIVPPRPDTEDDDDAPTPLPRRPRASDRMRTPRPTAPGLGETGPLQRASTPLPVSTTRKSEPKPVATARPSVPKLRDSQPPAIRAATPPPTDDADTDQARRLSTADLVDDAPDKEPAVRFARSSSSPALAAANQPKIQTKPGMAVAGFPGLPPRDLVADAALDGLRKKHDSDYTIGASIASRKTGNKTWLLVAGLVLAGAGATVVTLYATRGRDEIKTRAITTPEVTEHSTGTVKFVVEPIDAEVRVEGLPAHTGSPWSTELAAGVHQIEIHRSGYKAWLTSLELSPREQASLRVVLEPLGSSAATGDATLSVTTTPAGLDVLIDGQLQAQKTPIKTSIKVGAHVITVRQNGVEVWRQSVNAEASSDYEFNPSFTADKLRERAERSERPTARPAGHVAERVAPAESTLPEQTSEPAPSRPAPADEPAEPEVTHKGGNTVRQPTHATPAPPSPAMAAIAPPPLPPPSPAPAPAPAPAIASPPPVAAAPTAPIVVRPNAVSKISGDTPNIAAKGDVPPVVAAKVCIDTGGRVSSVDVISKLEHHAAADLADALRTWRYAPYKDKGAAVPACFSVTLRTR